MEEFMKNTHIIALVIGSCFVTFVVSVLFSINMVSISPENLAKVVKKEPLLFMETLKESARSAEEEMRTKAMEEQFKNPADIPTEGRVTFGDKAAPIAIVEFSDFQCPYCARAAKSMSALREKYDGKVKVVYKHFPLSFHPFAKPASEYFEAVAMIDHEKAKMFHDAIFDNFQDYAKLESDAEIEKSIKDILKKIDVKAKEVEDNLESAKKVVLADMEEAKKLNVGGTPSFFVNGIDAKGGNIEMIIDKLLAETKE